MNALTAFWEQEEQAAFSGWDFSHLQGRITTQPLPWCYEAWLREFLKKDTQLLDMGTGGGEFLLSLRHPYHLTSATEGYAPNFALCQKRLPPLGITLAYWEGNTPLPFADNCFDLVLNRHAYYNLQEVYRVLKPGGHFITQQVGAQNNLLVSRRLGLSYTPKRLNFNLENEVPAFCKAGFRVVKTAQAYPQAKLGDIGALCYLAKVLPWEFPAFSVQRCLPALLELQRELEQQGCVVLQEHRFILIGKKVL